MRTPGNMSELHRRLDDAIDDYVAFNGTGIKDQIAAGGFNADRHYVFVKEIQARATALREAYDAANPNPVERIAKAFVDTNGMLAPAFHCTPMAWADLGEEGRNLLAAVFIALSEQGVISFRR